MMRNIPWLMVALVSATGCGDTSEPEVTLSASLTDAAGDGGGADVVSASVEVAGNDMILSVVFTPASFHADSMLVQFNLDTDESAATGYTTTNPGHTGFGIDCMVEVGKPTLTSRSARVRVYDNGVFIAAASGTIRDITNGYEATVPADACDDDGPALIKVDAFRQVGIIGFTPRQDWAPDPGLPAVPLR